MLYLFISLFCFPSFKSAPSLTYWLSPSGDLLATIYTYEIYYISTYLAAEDLKEKTLFDADRVKKYVFVEEEAIGNRYAYKKITKPIDIDKPLKAGLKELSTLKLSVEAPSIGILANILLLDDKDQPVVALSVINYKRSVVIRDVKQVGDHLMIGDTRIERTSDAVSRWVYQQYKIKFPKQFTQQQEFYKKNGNSIESLLFPPFPKI